MKAGGAGGRLVASGAGAAEQEPPALSPSALGDRRGASEGARREGAPGGWRRSERLAERACGARCGGRAGGNCSRRAHVWGRAACGRTFACEGPRRTLGTRGTLSCTCDTLVSNNEMAGNHPKAPLIPGRGPVGLGLFILGH